MRGLVTIFTMCLFFISSNAQENNSLKQAAEQKAKSYTAKMMKTLDLSTEQAKAVYRLRYELSLGLQMIHLKYNQDEKLLMQFANDAKQDFQASIKKLLNDKQLRLLSEYKKDIVAAQQQSANNIINSTANFQFD